MTQHATESDGSSSGERPYVGWFGVWVWEPRRPLKYRGFSTALLGVYPGGFVVRAKRFPVIRPVRFREIVYEFPKVIVEVLWPTFGAHALIEIRRELGSVSVSRRAIASLRAANISVVEVRRWGWQAPRPVRADRLGLFEGDVPECALTR